MNNENYTDLQMYTNDLEKHSRDYENFIGEKKAYYYMDKFRSFVESDNKISWNWASFLFTSTWLAYRKMYSYAIGLYVLSMVINFIPKVNMILGLLINIGIGLFGNYIYFRYAEKNVDQAQSMIDDDEKEQFLGTKGGTSTIAVLLMLGLSVLYGFVTFYIQSKGVL